MDARFDVWLLAFDEAVDDPLPALQRVFGIDREHAEVIAGAVPRIVKHAASHEDASAMALALERIGATVELRRVGSVIPGFVPGGTGVARIGPASLPPALHMPGSVPPPASVPPGGPVSVRPPLPDALDLDGEPVSLPPKSVNVGLVSAPRVPSNPPPAAGATTGLAAGPAARLVAAPAAAPAAPPTDAPTAAVAAPEAERGLKVAHLLVAAFILVALGVLALRIATC